MAKNQFISGVGKVLLFTKDNQLFGVAKSLTQSTFNFGVESGEVRGGEGNALFGKYFYNTSLEVSMTDCMFNLEYLARNLGVDPEMGGLVWYESNELGETPAANGKVTLAHPPVGFNGSHLVWYKKPSDAAWNVGTANESGGSWSIIIEGASASDKYCIKYQYQDENSKFITIKAKYTPDVIHVVIINDLFSGDTNDVGSASKYGRLITDIPSLQLSGAQELSLSSTSAATIDLSGSALAVESGTSCEEDPYYGTMTQQIFGASWKDDVVACAVENADVDLNVGEAETLAIRVVYNGAAAQRKSNDNFVFAVESGSTSVCSVDQNGTITANGAGSDVISVTLKDRAGMVAYATVTVG